MSDRRTLVFRSTTRWSSTRVLVSGIGVLALVACGEQAPTAPAAAGARADLGTPSVTVTHYDAKSMAQYGQMWANIYGPLELAAGGTLSVSPSQGETETAVPFHVGADYSVFDHLKYMAVSTQSFAVPARGSLTFSVAISASTPGTIDGRVVHGCYGPPGSWDGVAACAQPWSATARQGQQAGVVLNMINFATGQLFDWFVSQDRVFALIERLPSNVTNASLLPTDPGYVGLSKAYTQIIREGPVAAGRAHVVAITFSRDATGSSVQYFLDGQLFARVNNVGIPLDVQGVPFTGTYPSLGAGEALASQLDSFVIGHGLFSLLDAFPFQHPERPDLSVSIPMSQRLFGQGAVGNFQHFTVVQASY